MGELVASGYGVGSAEGELVGREDELSAIAEFLERARAGAAAFLIEGEAGIGKTALWAQGVERARAQGFRVLATRPSSADARISFASLSDLLENAHHVLVELPSPQRRALEVALLLRPADGPALEAREVAFAMLTLLRTVAQTSPVLVAVDDAQWLDGGSVSALQFALRRLRREPVASLLTVREDPAITNPFDLEAERLRLGPLSVGALQRLLSARLDLSLRRPALRRLQELCGGNPFYALEFGRSMRRRGDLAEMPVPDSLAALVRERLAELPQSTRDALVAASALSAPTIELVEAVVEGDATEVLKPAISAGIVLVENERVRFMHPLLAHGAYADAPARSRRALHRQLAELVPDLEERARHLALATDEPDAEVAGLLEAAAAHAAARGAPAAAAELSALAAERTVSDDRTAMLERMLGAASSYHAAGRSARCRELAGQCVAELPPGPQRARALLLLFSATEERVGYELLERALGDAAGVAPLQAEVHLASCLCAVSAGDMRRARSDATTAVAFAEADGDERLLGRALGHLIMTDSGAGEWTSDELVERALSLDRRNDVPLFWGPTMAVGLRYFFEARSDEARALLQDLLQRAELTGEEFARVSALRLLVGVEALEGNHRRALVVAEEGVEASEQHERLQPYAGALYMKAYVQALLGRVEQARESAVHALAVCEEAGDYAFAIPTEGVLGFLHLSLGELDQAAARLRPLPARSAERGFAGLDHFLLANTIEALVGIGEVDEADALVVALEDRARRGLPALAGPQAARSRGLVAAARGDADKALAAFEEALAEHERLAAPFERARTLLVLGKLHRREKRRRVARQLLTEAYETFERLPAPLWSARAREELARIGGRAASSGELTSTEARVAALVAEGRSNKEVAAALFVTPKTVEVYLSRIYEKLGIHSRTELARWQFESTGARKL